MQESHAVEMTFKYKIKLSMNTLLVVKVKSDMPCIVWCIKVQYWIF